MAPTGEMQSSRACLYPWEALLCLRRLHALLQLPCARSRCPSGADGGSESLMLWGQPRRGAVWWDEGQGEEDGSRARRVRGGADKLNSLPLVTAVIWSREP